MKILERPMEQVRNTVTDYFRLWKLQRMFLPARGGTVSPHWLFAHVDDDEWFWLNTIGYNKSARLREILPAIPADDIQRRFNCLTGQANLEFGFRIYKLFKQIAESQLGAVTQFSNILDFGCGWGRLIRFFLKDLEPSKLWGIDRDPLAIETCQQINKWCKFLLIDPMPPTTFVNEMFELVYAYSVFSHLSEDVHNQWLIEFKRILKPGGLLILSTLPRDFIVHIGATAKQSPSFQSMGTAFPDTAESLADYDNGKYCHSSGKGANGSSYALTCIPKSYILKHWTKYLTFIDFVDATQSVPQAVIVMRNP